MVVETQDGLGTWGKGKEEAAALSPSQDTGGVVPSPSVEAASPPTVEAAPAELIKDILIIGAGPAGLSAAIEAAQTGASVLLVDENSRPGGQLFKQIHKFFGSREHRAGTRGIRIGEDLLAASAKLNIEVWLDTEACGLFQAAVATPAATEVLPSAWLVRKGKSVTVRARRIILATGAMENAVNFPGWTLPGVMSAGAAQTMINLHRVLPGRRVVMIGSGNVGVIVSYQLLQAGAEVLAVVEAAPRLGGYGVHTAKVRRAGVPFYPSHTVLKAAGRDRVEKVTLVALKDGRPVPGSEEELAADTVCIAAGLSPLSELALGAGCEGFFVPDLGGLIPHHDANMRSSLPSIYIAGDISGVEEASTAMEEGRLAGLAAAWSLGFLSPEGFEEKKAQVQRRLNSLRSGLFGEKRRLAKENILRENH
jgi:thioredoxin reductase